MAIIIIIGGAQNLHKLIFVDIKSDLIRSRILTHIKREAREVNFHFVLIYNHSNFLNSPNGLSPV